MKANEDKHLEEFTDKIMSETVLESPSFDFTSKVMSQVAAISLKNTTAYKPLISKTAWFIILGSIVLPTGYFVIAANPQGSNLFNLIDFSVLNNNSLFTSLSEFRFSNVTIYAVLLSAVMLFIQITLLRNHFDRRFKF